MPWPPVSSASSSAPSRIRRRPGVSASSSSRSRPREASSTARPHRHRLGADRSAVRLRHLLPPRPSAAGANGYAADAASGSNLGTKNPALRPRIALDVVRRIQQHTGDAALKALLDRLDTEQAALKAKNDIAEKSKDDTEAIAKLEGQVAATGDEVLAAAVKLGEDKNNLVPPDLVTASGGGLDPHISPESVRYQAGRVAAARKLTEARVLALIDANTDRSGAIIGAPPRVNVLKLNRLLDEEKPAARARSRPLRPGQRPAPPPSRP